MRQVNLALLLLGLRVWAGSPIEKITRVFCAVALFSLEMQLATWTGIATLQTLAAFNLALACGLYLRARRAADDAGAANDAGARSADGAARLAVVALAVVVLLLDVVRPVTAADPYHLLRAQRIEQLGTLAYDPGADPKLNVLGFLYELLLADLWATPGVGSLALRFHGMYELLLFVTAVAAVLRVLGASSRTAWMMCAVVPVVFHQFVLVKNDLFGAMPAVLVLAWLVFRVRLAHPLEIGWAAWLAGIAVGMKLTSFPLAIVAGAAVLIERREWRAILAATAGACIGLLSGGLLFTIVENSRVYGSAVEPLGELGNRNTTMTEVAISVTRFVVSLLDLGLVTRWWWPGRGGWGGTYGLPVIWALAVLTSAWRQREARRTLILSAVYWLAFAAVYPDADIAHRLAIAPGLLVIAVAGLLADRDRTVPRWLRAAAIPVVVLSALQIARSAALYLTRS